MKPYRWPIALAVIAAAAFCVSAAPRDPLKTKLSDEHLTLRGLKKLSLKVPFVPEVLRDVGVEPTEIRQMCFDLLDQAGLDPAGDDNVATLLVETRTEVNPQFPDALAILIVFTVHQPIELIRLDRQVTIPTASVTQLKVVSKDDAAQVYRKEVRKTTEFFIRLVRTASR